MRFEVFEDARGEWRWRLLAGNNRIVADGAEGYADQDNAVAAIGRIRAALQAIAAADIRSRPRQAGGRRRRRAGLTGYSTAAFAGLALDALANR